MVQKPLYKRILLKLSGEALSGTQKFGIEKNALLELAGAIKEVSSMGVQIGVVTGAGNLFRGADQTDFVRNRADQIGMLATLMNGLALQDALEKVGCEVRVLSAVPSGTMIEPYSWEKATSYLDHGYVVLFVGGTGNPYFTTDTAAVLRALETRCEILLKATKVDGIYDKDPLKFSGAIRKNKISYEEILVKRLKIMDQAAVSLSQENQLPIYVFDLFAKGALKKAVTQLSDGTLVTKEEDV